MSRQICSVREFAAADWEMVRQIYLEGIASGHATFETEAPTWQRWNDSHHRFARFVVSAADEVVGWSALSKVSQRQVYSGVAEVSVYVAAQSRGRGFGRALLEALIHAAEENEIWTLQASIFPENKASIELHQQCGFSKVGHRERIAKLNGVWRDTFLLERRSTLVGLD